MNNAPNSVLLLSSDASMPGGIAQFTQTLTEHFTHSNAELLCVGSMGAESWAARLLRIVRLPFAVVRRIRQGGFDVVHLNPPFKGCTLIREGLVLLALRAARYHSTLIYFHGWQQDTERFIRRTPLLRQCVAWLLNGAGHILVLSPEFKRGLEAIGVRQGKISVTRTMIDSGLAKKERMPAGERRTILFLSRFVRAKGGARLLEAFARLAGDYPDVDVVMAGDGKEMLYLQAIAVRPQLRGRVRFTGYVTGSEKWRLLSECAFMVLPTDYPEGMPIAVLEAMAAGKPIVTTRTGALRYIVSRENGAILQDTSVEAIESAMRELLSDPERCNAVGERNAAYAARCFCARKVTGEIEAIYARLGGKRQEYAA